MLAALAGLAVGAGQFLLLRLFSACALAGKTSRGLLWLMCKLALYAASFAAVFLWFPAYALWFAGGIAVALVLGAALQLLFKRR